MIALALPMLLRLGRRLVSSVVGVVAPSLSGVGGILSVAAPIALGCLCLITALLWFRLGASEAARDALEVERGRLTLSIEAQQTAIAARDAALDVLSAEAEAAQARAEALSLARQEILDAPPGDDGAVAPVLGRALERLRGGARP